MPYAFYVSPRESSSFPKILFCLAGSLPWDRAPTSTPSQWLGDLTPFPKIFPILLRSVFPLLPPSPGHWGQCHPPVGGGGGWGGSSTAQIWCFRALDQLLNEIAADPYNYWGEKKNHNSLCKTQNCLKGVCVWWGVPRGGRVAVGGWGCGWVKQTNWVRGSFLFNSRSGRTHGVGSSVHVNSTLSLSPKLGAKIQRFTLVLGRYRRRTELCSSETTEQKFLKHH